MRHAQHLASAGKFGQFARHFLCGTPGNAGVHLVKHQRAHAVAFGQHIFQRQHHARKFAAGGHARKRLRRLAGVHRNQKRSAVNAVRGERGAFLAGMRQADLKPRARHIQIGEFFADACFQRTRRLLAAGRERLRQRKRRVILFRRLFFQVLQTVVRIFHPVQLRAAVVQIRQHVRHGAAIAF